MEGLLAVHPPIRLNFIPKPRRRLVSIFSYGPGLIPSPRMSGRVYFFFDGLFRNLLEIPVYRSSKLLIDMVQDYGILIRKAPAIICFRCRYRDTVLQ